MVHANMIQNRQLIVQMGDKNSRRRRLKNGVPQGSVISSALSNLYTYGMPVMGSKKYIYGGDLVFLRCDNEFKFIETVLSIDLDILRDYFPK